MAYPISDVTRRIIYSGSAGVGPYSFSFEILEQTDVAVYKNSTLLTLTTDYSVTINADGTGSVTLVSAATASDQITLFGDRAIERSTDFVTGGDLFANSLNEELDSQTIFAQQIDEKADRAIKAPITDPTTVDMTLPSKADRAEKLLSFDIDGNPDVTSAADIAAGISGAIVGANYVVTNATGNGSSVAFTVSSAPGAKSNIQIYIDGVYQNKDTFSISGTTVTFTEAPPSGAAIEFVVGYAIGVGGGAAEITYTPAGTGAQQTTVQSKLREHVSVRDFGAVGDGVTDDTAAIQAAIDSCISEGVSLFVPSGQYLLSDTLTIQAKGFTLRGESSAKRYEEYTPQTEFIFSNSTTGIKFAYSFSTRLTEQCVLENIAINGGASLATGIVVEGGMIYIRDCSVYNAVDGISLLTYINGTVIDNCSFSYNTGTGITVGGSEVFSNTSLIIKNTIARVNDDYGLVITESTGGVFDNCIFESNGRSGVLIDCGAANHIDSLTFNNVWVENNCLVSLTHDVILTADSSSHRPFLCTFNQCFVSSTGSTGCLHVIQGQQINFNYCSFIGGTGEVLIDSGVDNVSFLETNSGAITDNSGTVRQGLNVLQQVGTYAPTITAASGSITAYTASGYYSVVGDIVEVTVKFTITTKGTAGGAMTISLPVSCGESVAGYGAEFVTSGKTLLARTSNGTTNALVYLYDVTSIFTLADGMSGSCTFKYKT